MKFQRTTLILEEACYSSEQASNTIYKRRPNDKKMSSTVYAEIAKKAGYSDMVADQEVMLTFLVQLTARILEPAEMIVSSCGNKKTTISDSHFKVLAQLSQMLCSHQKKTAAKAASAGGGHMSRSPTKKSKASKTGSMGVGMDGGSAVLPLQYFGVDDYGNNYSSDFGDAGHSPWSDPALTRTGLSASFSSSTSPFKWSGCGGGGCTAGGASLAGASVITDSTITIILRELNDKMAKERVRLTDTAKQILKKILFATAVDMLRVEKSGSATSGKKKLDNGKIKTTMNKSAHHMVNFSPALA